MKPVFVWLGGKVLYFELEGFAFMSISGKVDYARYPTKVFV